MPGFNLTCDKFCGLFGVSPVETGKINLFIWRKKDIFNLVNTFALFRNHEGTVAGGSYSKAGNSE